jgi:hypothetical protein
MIWRFSPPIVEDTIYPHADSGYRRIRGGKRQHDPSLCPIELFVGAETIFSIAKLSDFRALSIQTSG